MRLGAAYLVRFRFVHSVLFAPTMNRDWCTCSTAQHCLSGHNALALPTTGPPQLTADAAVRLTAQPFTISLGTKNNPHASGEIFLVLRTRGLVFSAPPALSPVLALLEILKRAPKPYSTS